MKILRLVPLLSWLLVGACEPTVDEVRSEPLQWTATYAKPFEDLATCMTGRISSDFTVTPQSFPRDGLIRLILKNGPIVSADVTVRQTSTGQSQVEMRRKRIVGDVTGAYGRIREAADRCGA